MLYKTKEFKNITLEERIKDIIRISLSFLYKRPRNIFQLIRNPQLLKGPTYFPEKVSKSKRRILLEQIKNILLYEEIEPYYYLYGMDVYNGHYSREFIAYNVFLRRRNRLNFRSEHNSTCILRNKLYFGEIAKSLGIPSPKNILLSLPEKKGYCVWLQDGTTHSLVDILSKLDGNFFCKPLDGECGSGIGMLRCERGGLFWNGLPINVDYLINTLCSSEYLVQEALTQHPVLSEVYPLSINTLRLVTVVNVNTGEIEVFPSALRIGNKGNKVDNFSLGGVIVNIDYNSGLLEPVGFMKAQYGTTCTHHPETGKVFSGVKVPYLSEAIEMAIKFHSHLNVHSVGWDIAITENGPCFIEGNDNWEIDVQQNALHPLKKEFRRLFYKTKNN